MDLERFTKYLALVRNLKPDYAFIFRCPGCAAEHTLPLVSAIQGFPFPCGCGEAIALTREEQAAVTVLQAVMAGLAATDKKISITSAGGSA